MEGFLGLGVPWKEWEGADAVGEAFVKGVGVIAGVYRGGIEHDGALEEACKSIGGYLADGVSVGVHFVDVFGQGEPGSAGCGFPAVFGVKCMDFVFATRVLYINDDIGAEVVGEGSALGGCVCGVVRQGARKIKPTARRMLKAGKRLGITKGAKKFLRRALS